MHTANPTAKRLKIDIADSHTHGNEADLVKEVLGRPESTLIVWHHGTWRNSCATSRSLTSTIFRSGGRMNDST